MKLLFINGKYLGKVRLTQEALDCLKKFKKIAIYTTTQFSHRIPEIIKQLEKLGIEVVSSQPERTSEKAQILGCDIYHGNLNINEEFEAYLYIGDGNFHPRALLFYEHNSDSDRKVVVFNPKSNKIEVLDNKEIEKILIKEETNLKRFLIAGNIGILITTKPGQEHWHYINDLGKKYPDKNFYSFVTDNISFSEMENFPFIQAWVNTACPRIGAEDLFNTDKALVNVESVLKI